MACFRPIKAWRLANGSIHFGAEKGDCHALTLPCGYCLGCRLSRAQGWAVRCMHEASMHAVSSFVTLTYDDEHYSPSLNYRDFQLFMRRLRRAKGAVRFFMCGEYGEKFKRPHFHALLFGVGFSDLKPCGRDIYQSGELDRLWERGYASVGSVSHESAGYVARYSVKKVFGPQARYHYERVHLGTGELVQVEPEFAHMSLKPGIGKPWFLKYWREVYVPRDGVCLAGGRVVRAPRAYDRYLAEISSDLRDYKDYERYVRSAQFVDDTTPERLATREAVAAARLSVSQRRLE